MTHGSQVESFKWNSGVEIINGFIENLMQVLKNVVTIFFFFNQCYIVVSLILIAKLNYTFLYTDYLISNLF